MAEKKRQHFVPKMYLKRFSADGKSLRIFNLRSARFIDGASLREQCYRDYMYGRTPEREDALGSVEGIANIALDRVVEKCAPPLPSEKEFSTLLLFIAVQYARTSYQADAIEESFDKLIRRLGSHDATLSELYRLGGSVTVNNVPALNVAQAADSHLLLSDLGWMLLRAAPQTEFILSDAPVVCYNQLLEPLQGLSTTGWAWKGLQVLVPISPEYTLVLYDRTTYRTNPKQDTVFQATPQDVLSLNLVQYVAAHENLYFRGARQFELERLHKMGKGLRRKDKTRQSVHDQPPFSATTSSELIVSGKVDVRVGLALSVLTIQKPAKTWASTFMSQRIRPANSARNPLLYEKFREYQAAVKDGTYQRGQFLAFLATGHERDRQHAQARSLLRPL